MPGTSKDKFIKSWSTSSASDDGANGNAPNTTNALSSDGAWADRSDALRSGLKPSDPDVFDFDFKEDTEEDVSNPYDASDWEDGNSNQTEGEPTGTMHVDTWHENQSVDPWPLDEFVL
ncbi:MAG: hypothetical protein AAGF94_17345 [Pseudomonadota bacterium]